MHVHIWEALEGGQEAWATGAGLIKCQCNASSNSFHMSHKSNQTKSKAKPVDSQLLLLLLLLLLLATASGKYLTEFHCGPRQLPVRLALTLTRCWNCVCVHNYAQLAALEPATVKEFSGSPSSCIWVDTKCKRLKSSLADFIILDQALRAVK